MLYLGYIVRDFKTVRSGDQEILFESFLEPRMFDASDEFFEEAIGSRISTFAGRFGTPEIPEEIARRLVSHLESHPPEEDILFAVCSAFQGSVVLALCNEWAKLKA